jgi:hypothetical protein
LGGRALIHFTEFEAIENEDAGDTEVFEGLELLLDIAPQGEGKSTERAQQRFPGGLVDEVLGDVVRRIDTDHGAFQGGQREGLGATHGPFIEGTDCGRKDMVRGVQFLGVRPGSLVLGMMEKCHGLESTASAGHGSPEGRELMVGEEE